MIGTMTALNNTPCYIRNVSQKKDMFIEEDSYNRALYYTKYEFLQYSSSNKKYKQFHTNKTQNYWAVIYVTELM